MVLSSLLKPSCVIVHMHARDRVGVLRELAGNLARQGPLDEDSLFALLTNREEEGSTSLGGGLVIPHCFANGIPHPLVCLGRSLAGINFGAADGRPARYFVGLVSPLHRAQTHCRLVASIATLFHTPYFKHDLLDATSREEILRVINDAEATANHPPARAA
jgi:mannitol/fructose-specific phosphotransferase system IIA component (Ntr-type)